jgi:hypothetical protein
MLANTTHIGPIESLVTDRVLTPRVFELGYLIKVIKSVDKMVAKRGNDIYIWVTNNLAQRSNRWVSHRFFLTSTYCEIQRRGHVRTQESLRSAAVQRFLNLYFASTVAPCLSGG